MNMPVEVYGDGQQISDMIYVEDVAKALVLSLEHAKEGDVFDRAVEVGPEENKTVQEIAELIIKLCNSKSQIKNLPMRPGEIPNSTVCADVETLKLIKMSDLVPLEIGMEKTVKYYELALASIS